MEALLAAVVIVGVVGGVWWVIQSRKQPSVPRERTAADIHREDAVELPKMRFTDDGDPTDSFIVQLKQRGTDEDEA